MDQLLMTGSKENRTHLPLDAETGPDWVAPKVEVRGHRAYRNEASAWIQTTARTADLSLAFLSFTAFLKAADLGQSPRLWWVAGIGFSYLLQTALFIGFFGKTPGEFFWQLNRAARPSGLRSLFQWTSWLPGKDDQLLQCEKISTETFASGIAGTLISLFLAIKLSVLTLFSFPIWKAAELTELEPYFPTESTERDWTPIPFFYALGTWPLHFQGTPVLYRLPYEKGPPTRFVGHLIARWNSPSVEVTIEGPKTPLANFSREEIRSCLVSSSPLRCLGVRETVLSRHTEELGRGRSTTRHDSSIRWKLGWFTVKNPALAPEERLQGFSIHASHDSFERHRYVIVTPKGIHQSFTITAPPGLEGATARETFEKSLRSLRVSDELSSGIAWIDRRLESIRLGNLGNATEPDEVIRKYAEIQSLLLAKISVDPKTYDTYYHLAGVSLTLAKYLEQLLQTPPHLNSPEALQLPLQELLSASSGLIDSAYRYALDVKPNEPRNSKIKAYLDQAGQIKR